MTQFVNHEAGNIACRSRRCRSAPAERYAAWLICRGGIAPFEFTVYALLRPEPEMTQLACAILALARQIQTEKRRTDETEPVSSPGPTPREPTA